MRSRIFTPKALVYTLGRQWAGELTGLDWLVKLGNWHIYIYVGALVVFFKYNPQMGIFLDFCGYSLCETIKLFLKITIEAHCSQILADQNSNPAGGLSGGGFPIWIWTQ
jgi:hypothetical protein